MKKLLGIVVLGLLCSNISFAEMIQSKCKTKKISIMKGNKLENISSGGDTIFLIDLEKNLYYRDDMDIKSFFINTEDKILWYEFGGNLLQVSKGYMLSHSKLNRFTGEWIYKFLYLNEDEFKIIKKKFDIINKSIKNYKPAFSNKTEYYQVTENSPKSLELKKYKIIEKEYKSKKFSKDYVEGYWQCNNQKKQF